MSDIKVTEFKRNELKEKQFKARYNRDVEIYQKNYIKDKEFIQGDILIKYKDNEYLLQEFLKEGLTDYTLFKLGDKTWKYNTHLEAEVCVADKIGESDGNNI